MDLDAWCSRHFTFRQLIECGETWRRLADERPGAIDNRPRAPETFEAIAWLCERVLDPLVDAFGAVELTYGFASPALIRHIPHGIAPRLDQHSGCEHNAKGKPICDRGGQSVDLRVPGRSSIAVAAWLARNTPFDRLYLYGPDRPLHVSSSAHPVCSIVDVRNGPSGRRFPHPVTLAWLDELAGSSG